MWYFDRHTPLPSTFDMAMLAGAVALVYMQKWSTLGNFRTLWTNSIKQCTSAELTRVHDVV
jgi:hypothetical protein